MIVNCTYFLLKHGAKQCCLYLHFVGRQNGTWLAPLPSKRHKDVILEKIVWRCPLSILDYLLYQDYCISLAWPHPFRKRECCHKVFVLVNLFIEQMNIGLDPQLVCTQPGYKSSHGIKAAVCKLLVVQGLFRYHPITIKFLEPYCTPWSIIVNGLNEWLVGTVIMWLSWHEYNVTCGLVSSHPQTPPSWREKGSGYNTTSHPPQWHSRLACEMANHSTVRVIVSAVLSHVALVVYHRSMPGSGGMLIVTRPLFLSTRVGSGHETTCDHALFTCWSLEKQELRKWEKEMFIELDALLALEQTAGISVRPRGITCSYTWPQTDI